MAFTIHSSIGKIMSNAQAKAIVEKHVPGASTHPQLADAWSMSLGEVATFPESGLTNAKLQALLADLATITDA